MLATLQRGLDFQTINLYMCVYLTWIVQGHFQRSGRQALEEVYQLFFQPCVQQENMSAQSSVQNYYKRNINIAKKTVLDINCFIMGTFFAG